MTSSKSHTFTSLKQSLSQENPLQIAGAINAITAMLAKSAGFKAIYLSGAGVANACFGLPDLGLTTCSEVAEEIRRMRAAVDLPILADSDTGFGSVLNVARTVKMFECAGASALHIEDQTWPKKCGHLPGKEIVSVHEMENRIKAAVDARKISDFVIMARTDALQNEGLNAAIDRASSYVKAGADMIFAEAFGSLQDYQNFTKHIKVPVLANITEFGKTPLFTVPELKSAGVQLILYPLSAFRTMNQAVLRLYQGLRKEGSQKGFINEMQTREDLYKLLNYQDFEIKLKG